MQSRKPTVRILLFLSMEKNISLPLYIAYNIVKHHVVIHCIWCRILVNLTKVLSSMVDSIRRDGLPQHHASQVSTQAAVLLNLEQNKGVRTHGYGCATHVIKLLMLRSYVAGSL
jgi:hypothetical protein